MHSRLASRVLWPLAEFECANEQDLYQGVPRLALAAARCAPKARSPWTRTCPRPELTHERYAAQRVKDAIVDRIRSELGVRPSVDVEDPDCA
jgi:23S rRNA (guanine2445-N2)-methyltransferase / 23S rRNA (guanine2069-N7)-methyltransferase